MNVLPWQDDRFITVLKPSSTLRVRERNGSERLVASTEYFGRISVARDGQAVFEQALERQDRGEPLRSGVVTDPSSDQRGYRKRSAHPARRERLLLYRRKCGAFPQILCTAGRDEMHLTAAGHYRSRFAGRFAERQTHRYHDARWTSNATAVLSPEGAVQDFGPIVNDCRVRWNVEDRIWMFARTSDFSRLDRIRRTQCAADWEQGTLRP